VNLRRLLGLRPPPPPADEWERRYQRGYAGDATDIAEAGHFALVAAYIRAAAGTAPRVVDAGCGRGQLLDQFGRGEIGTYWAFDLSETAVRDARARASRLGLAEDGITVGGFDDWKPQQPLDAVIFCESLTYASDPLAMLERYMGYLADGGCGVVSLYRNRQAITIGKRIERSFSVIDSSSVVHRSGKRWDVRLLRPGAR
jgi:SAM-dependent methyltransferase